MNRLPPFNFRTLQRVVDDAPIKRVERFQFDHVAPAFDFFRGFAGFLDQRLAGLGAIAAHVDGHFGGAFVLAEKDPVQQILQVGEGLPLAPDQAPGIVSFHVQGQTIFIGVFLDGAGKAKMLEHLFEDLFWLGRHECVDVLS
jgi:hypothetical protein